MPKKYTKLQFQEEKHPVGADKLEHTSLYPFVFLGESFTGKYIFGTPNPGSLVKGGNPIFGFI